MLIKLDEEEDAIQSVIFYKGCEEKEAAKTIRAIKRDFEFVSETFLSTYRNLVIKTRRFCFLFFAKILKSDPRKGTVLLGDLSI